MIPVYLGEIDEHTKHATLSLELPVERILEIVSGVWTFLNTSGPAGKFILICLCGCIITAATVGGFVLFVDRRRLYRFASPRVGRAIDTWLERLERETGRKEAEQRAAEARAALAEALVSRVEMLHVGPGTDIRISGDRPVLVLGTGPDSEESAPTSAPVPARSMQRTGSRGRTRRDSEPGSNE